MDAIFGTMPGAVVWLVLSATAAGAPSADVQISVAIVPTDHVQSDSRAIEKKPARQPTSPVIPTPPQKLSGKSQSPQAPTVPPLEPAPPPDQPPSESAPAGAGFAVPTIGDAYIPEVPLEPNVPIGLAPTRGNKLHKGAAEDDSLIIDHTWRGGDAGLASLCGLPSITSLTIKNAPLTDAALDYIAALPNLKVLKIESTTFSPAGLAKLRRQRAVEIVVGRGIASAGESTTR